MCILVLLAALPLVPAARLAFHPHANGIGRPSNFHHRVPASASLRDVTEKEEKEESLDFQQKLDGLVGGLFGGPESKPVSEEPSNQEDDQASTPVASGFFGNGGNWFKQDTVEEEQAKVVVKKKKKKKKVGDKNEGLAGLFKEKESKSMLDIMGDWNQAQKRAQQGIVEEEYEYEEEEEEEEDQAGPSSGNRIGNFLWQVAGDNVKNTFSKQPEKQKELPVESSIESEESETQGFISRKLLLAGVAAQPVLYATVNLVREPFTPKAAVVRDMSEGPYASRGGGLPDSPKDGRVWEDYKPDDANTARDVAIEGYANQLPLGEENIIDAWEEGKARPGSKEMEEMVETLEARKGASFQSSSIAGRWVMPWIGGWQQIYCSDPDLAYIGGPITRSFKKNGTLYYQYSARNYFYGPGPGGMTTEYLYKPVEKKDDDGRYNVLLARAAVVENEGNNFWTAIFPDPLKEFETETRTAVSGGFQEFENEFLLEDKPRGLVGEAAPTCRLQTTYLSNQVWVIRDAANPDKVVVYKRTSTRSVVDRRGLIAEGQVRPPKDDTIRFGGLLFEDKKEDYQGWTEKVLKNQVLKDKLLN